MNLFKRNRTDIEFLGRREISKEFQTVPKGCIWITREVLVDGVQNASWFIWPPFNSVYFFNESFILGKKVYLQWNEGKGRVKKAITTDIGRNIGITPVFFSEGMEISTFNERTVLKVYEFNIGKLNNLK